MLGEEAVDDSRPSGVSVSAAARRSCGSLKRSHEPRASSVSTTSVALAFEVWSRRRTARSSSSPPAVARITSTKKPVGERPSRSRSSARRRRTFASARSSDSSARWASGSPGTSCIAPGSSRRAGRGAALSDVSRRLAQRLPVGHRVEALEPVQARGLGGPELAAVERADQLVDGGKRLGRQARDGARAAVGQRAAEVVDRDLVAADAARGEDEPAERVEVGALAGEHDRARLDRVQRARRARRVEADGERQRAQAAAAQRQLERLPVERLDVARDRWRRR